MQTECWKIMTWIKWKFSVEKNFSLKKNFFSLAVVRPEFLYDCGERSFTIKIWLEKIEQKGWLGD